MNDNDEGEEVLTSDLVALIGKMAASELHEHLRLLEQTRCANLFALITDVDFQPVAALDALMIHLTSLETWSRGRLGGALEVLLQRLLGDLQTGIDATLSGSGGTVSDVGRDLMEIEFLLYEFASSTDRAASWLGSSRRDLIKYWSPSKVRDQEAKRRYPGAGMQLPDELEYRAHSQVTHLTPIGGRSRDLCSDHEPTWMRVHEILGHFHRCLLALDPFLDEDAPDVQVLLPFGNAIRIGNDRLTSIIEQLPPEAHWRREPRAKSDPLIVPGLE